MGHGRGERGSKRARRVVHGPGQVRVGNAVRERSVIAGRRDDGDAPEAKLGNLRVHPLVRVPGVTLADVTRLSLPLFRPKKVSHDRGGGGVAASHGVDRGLGDLAVLVQRPDLLHASEGER